MMQAARLWVRQTYPALLANCMGRINQILVFENLAIAEPSPPFLKIVVLLAIIFVNRLFGFGLLSNCGFVLFFGYHVIYSGASSSVLSQQFFCGSL